jgi:FlaA1/EpsC-like NDP-sugar epimerase
MNTLESASMRRQILNILQGKRAAILCVVYSTVIAFSFYLSYGIRFDFAVPVEHQRERIRIVLIVVLVKLTALFFARQMGSMLTFFGVQDIFRLGSAFLFSVALLILPRFLGFPDWSPPRGVLLIDLLVCMATFCSLRLGARLFRERFLMGQKTRGRPLERVAIIGAGDTAASLVGSLISTPSRGFRPVAFLDDDIVKHGMFIHGVAVEGKPEDFCKLSQLEGVRRAIIAMPSAPQKRIAEIALFLRRLDIQVETVPALEDLASGRARANRIRPLEIQDLLGRSVVELDMGAIGQFIDQKIVLVTGAGGSIGRELCRQIVRLNPRRLILVEQSEPSLFEIEQDLIALGFSDSVLPVIADIMDATRMRALFSTHNPQVVFHAAAHKHVHLMERHPSEAIKNNAVGTRRLAEIAVDHGVETFILISTDKAINPMSVMGASKRLAELHLLALHSGLCAGDHALEHAVRSEKPISSSAEDVRMATSQGSGEKASPHQRLRTKLMAVRFGNVLGSSGSVVPIFKKQIEAGGPVTVTHPDVTRYFMTIPEAVGLVLQASVLGDSGDILVLDMGSPVKIVDLATNMIELSGNKVGDDIEIKFTGLRLGEKLFEELQHGTEEHLPTTHPRIFRFVGDGDASKASRMAIEELEPFVDELPNNDLKRILNVVIPEYRPSLE